MFQKVYDELKPSRKEIIGLLVLMVSLTVLLKGIIGLGKCVSGSMEPYIYTGDLHIYNRLAYIEEVPQRGDVIIFDWGTEIYMKRVVAIEGDTVYFKDGKLYLNGEKADESYLIEERGTYSNKEFEVPAGCVFVLGDNRGVSSDSRRWDNPYVNVEDIKGKSFCVIPIHKLVFD